jgi:hypothetical protein
MIYYLKDYVLIYICDSYAMYRIRVYIDCETYPVRYIWEVGVDMFSRTDTRCLMPSVVSFMFGRTKSGVSTKML